MIGKFRRKVVPAHVIKAHNRAEAQRHEFLTSKTGGSVWPGSRYGRFTPATL